MARKPNEVHDSAMAMGQKNAEVASKASVHSVSLYINIYIHVYIYICICICILIYIHICLYISLSLYWFVL